MGQENIKQLLQCEKMALQIISDARKEKEELKRRAKLDAHDIRDERRTEVEKELIKLREKNAEKLRKIEEASIEENKEQMKQLEKVDHKYLVAVIVEMIKKVSK